jgi:hypothetical protein
MGSSGSPMTSIQNDLSFHKSRRATPDHKGRHYLSLVIMNWLALLIGGMALADDSI